MDRRHARHQMDQQLESLLFRTGEQGVLCKSTASSVDTKQILTYKTHFDWENMQLNEGEKNYTKIYCLSLLYSIKSKQWMVKMFATRHKHSDTASNHFTSTFGEEPATYLAYALSNFVAIPFLRLFLCTHTEWIQSAVPSG